MCRVYCREPVKRFYDIIKCNPDIEYYFVINSMLCIEFVYLDNVNMYNSSNLNPPLCDLSKSYLSYLPTHHYKIYNFDVTFFDDKDKIIRIRQFNDTEYINLRYFVDLPIGNYNFHNIFMEKNIYSDNSNNTFHFDINNLLQGLLYNGFSIPVLDVIIQSIDNHIIDIVTNDNLKCNEWQYDRSDDYYHEYFKFTYIPDPKISELILPDVKKIEDRDDYCPF